MVWRYLLDGAWVVHSYVGPVVKEQKDRLVYSVARKQAQMGLTPYRKPMSLSSTLIKVKKWVAQPNKVQQQEPNETLVS